MNFLNNIKVNTKLSVLVIIASISLFVIGGVGYYYLQQANTQMTIMYEERFVPNDEIGDILSNIRANNSFILEMMLTKDEKKNQELKQAVTDGREKINKTLVDMEKLPMNSKATELMKKIKESQQKYRPEITTVIELASQNKNVEAYTLYSTQLTPLINGYVDNVKKLSDYYTELGKRMDTDSKQAARHATQMTMGFIFAVFVILAIIGRTISKMITKPLQVLVSDCNELAAGDFSDKPRKIIRKDEIGQVEDALIKMQGSIRDLMKKISESSEQVAASSEELTASAEQSAQASNQIATSINEIAEGANEQLESTDETSAVIEQLSAGIQQVAANTNQVADQSSMATEKAKEGGKVIERAVTQMNAIANTTHAFAENIATLNEKSKDIGQIVDTISGIAGQTNLLALNAAIEAARAGDHGRGFAVVADEVRKLAEESQIAAKKIAELIGEIQGDTSKAVVAMNDSSSEVKTGTDVVTTAGKAFQEIIELISLVSSQVTEISSAIQQMASGSQQIVNSIRKIDVLSKKSAGDSQSVSAATEEQLASMEEIASSSQALANLAQDLQVAVAKFKV